MPTHTITIFVGHGIMAHIHVPWPLVYEPLYHALQIWLSVNVSTTTEILKPFSAERNNDSPREDFAK